MGCLFPVDDFVCGPPSAGSDFSQFESLHSGSRTFLNHEAVGKDEWDAPPPPPPPPPPASVVVSNASDQSAPLEPWDLDRKDTIDDELVRWFQCSC